METIISSMQTTGQGGQHTGPGVDAAQLPVVSVIVPYYNQPAFILETVQSVKQQSYPNIELIIVDDGSRFPAAGVLGGIEGVKLYTTANGGCPAARNYGFERSTGEYLVFLDGDDLLHPRAIEENLAALLGEPGAVLSFGAVRVVDERGEELQAARVCRPRRNYFWMLLETNPIWSTGATLIRRDAFVRAGKFRVYGKFQVDDYELYLYLARTGKFARHTSCVLDYRRHGGNMSNNREKMLQATLEVLDKLAVEEELSMWERLLLRHGRRRWIHSYGNQQTIAARCLNIYFRLATAWNLARNKPRKDGLGVDQGGSELTRQFCKSQVISIGNRN